MRSNLSFYNDVINKRKLQDLMYQTFQNYGVVKSSIIADRVKNLTFHFATQSGISLNTEDLRVPYSKRDLIGLTNAEVEATERNYLTGTITSVERFQKVIDIWNTVSNTLKDEVLTYFRESDPLNPLYIMAFSGARGNISQVRQLVGMRGLMADPQGQIIDLPIRSNFREGLKITEYVISSYGARKGLVDTALRTADSGYLTRRLVDVAQDLIVRDEDCQTMEGLSYDDLFNRYPTTLSLKDRIIGRLLLNELQIEGNPPVTLEKNTEITLEFFKSQPLKPEDINVRSPLTCNSFNSICRKCYGWHLSYSKIVDLGEAVGILAAQSIGEPGTQLTMRTFHTGGVFSGDLTRQIRAPFSGQVSYALAASTTLIRTMSGEKGFKLNETVDLMLENASQMRTSLTIPVGSILLVNTLQKVYKNQILAEITKDTNLLREEDSKNIYTVTSGETFFQNIELSNVVDSHGSFNTTAKTKGIIWVLQGERYSVPIETVLKIKVGQSISPGKVFAEQTLKNKYTGIVKRDSPKTRTALKILVSSLSMKNIKYLNYANQISLKVNGFEKRFLLKAKINDFVEKKETIAVLDDETFKTTTGGILYYDISNKKVKKQNLTKKLFSGSLYWIPEETHLLNSSLIDDLLISHDTIIPPNTEIWPGHFSKLGGLVEFNEVSNELVIKPGELFIVTNDQPFDKFKKGIFVKAGNLIYKNIFAQTTCYIELVKHKDISYLFVRPVQHYAVPREKGFYLEHLFFPKKLGLNLKLKTIKRLFFPNGERIKSNTGITLLQTFLVVDFKNKEQTLKPQIEFISPQENPNRQNLKISLYENIKTESIVSKLATPNLSTDINYTVCENQYIYPHTTIAKIQTSLKHFGTLIALNANNSSLKDILILKEPDIKNVAWEKNHENLLVEVGDLIRIGSKLTNRKKSKFSGQIYSITDKEIKIRLGRPYLISEGSILRVKSGAMIQHSDILATLVYDKLKTVDIVQGLPKVEEILEARKIKNSCLLAPCEGKVYLKNDTINIITPAGNTFDLPIDKRSKIKFRNGDVVNAGNQLTDGQISPHDLLNTFFVHYSKLLNINEACKLSFKYLQLFLVNEVQRTYLMQGVHIADKHIEVIVKQMTSKVKVEESGDTTLLPGEILNLYSAEQITKAALIANDNSPFYVPILLGLTKASLNSNSFISAASFQETTRVLTEAAIEGKKDWLHGLKENVIIGRLIPAGTGFNCYTRLTQKSSHILSDKIVPVSTLESIKEKILENRLKNIF